MKFTKNIITMHLNNFFRNYFLIVFLIICTSSISCAQSGKRLRKQKVAKVIKKAKSFKGTKYKWGGTTRKGIDCSGLMCQSFKTAGIKLPRRSQDQSKFGKKRSINNLAPGDMVFFRFKKKGGGRWWHSGLITETKKGKIMFIHASSSRGVIESSLSENYYKKGIQGFRRIIK